MSLEDIAKGIKISDLYHIKPKFWRSKTKNHEAEQIAASWFLVLIVGRALPPLLYDFLVLRKAI
jgi:hypothetical protein